MSQDKTWGEKLDDANLLAAKNNREARKVIRSTDLRWEEDKMARSALLVSEQTGFSMKCLHSFIAEMPAGATTGRHRHTSEAVMYALSGKAYSIIEEERVEWSAGDMVVMPAMSWHQHFNASETEPFRYLAVSNYPMTVNLGIALIETSDIRSDLKKK